MRILRRAFLLLVCATCAARAVVAADWRHEVQVDDSAKLLEKHLNESAAEGYKVTAVIGDVAHHAVLMSRRAAGEPGRFVYRVLDGVSDKEIAPTGREGFRWVGGAVEHLGSSPFFVLEREAKALEPVDLKVFAVNDPDATRRDLGALLAQGWSIAGGFATPQRPGGMVLLERRAGAGPRDLELFEDTDPGSSSRHLAASAKEGYGLDAFWTQPVGSRPGPPGLAMALLSRRKGDTAPGALRLTREDDPAHSHQRLAAWAPFKTSRPALETLYVYSAADDGSYDVCLAPAPGLWGSARDVQVLVEHALRACETNQVVATWVMPGEDGVPVFHFVTRR